MKRQLLRFREIQREDGLLSALHSTKLFIQDMIIYCYCVNIPQKYKIKEFDIGGISARFECGPQAGKPRDLIEGDEREQIQSVLNEIEQDDIFFDIGANIGAYTCFAGAKCNEGEVVAFEPHPPNVRQLRKNIRNSELSNVQVEAVGLSDERKTIALSGFEDKVGLRTGSIKPSTGGGKYQVQICTGDDLVENGKIPEPDVIKIDVEGAEAAVIRGLENTLRSGVCRTIFCEIHPEGHHPDVSSIEDFGMTPDELILWLQNVGFEECYLRERGGQLHLKMNHTKST